jgi:tetratricopeptide (TPR) repeat protein
MLAAFVPFALLVPLAVYADGGKGATASKKNDTPSVAAPSPKFREACVEGNTKYAARDFAGAVESYRKAIEIEPKNPLGHYFLGEAQLAAGNLQEAEAAWTRAQLVATDKDAPTAARVLFCLADLKERQKKWPEAKAAWQAYIDFATKSPDAGAFATSGQSRVQVIDAMMKLAQSYDVVKKRIEETKDGGVFSDPNKPAPSSS